MTDTMLYNNFGDYMVINTILIIFPILLYFAYSIRNKVFDKEQNDSILEFGIYTSLYLLFRYGYINEYAVILTNCFLIISYYKKRTICSLTISFIIVIFYSYYVDYDILTISIYLFYFALYMFEKEKFIEEGITRKVIVFLSILMYICYFRHLMSLYFISSIVLFSFISNVVMEIIDEGDNVISIYKSLDEIKHDKLISSSLFKITHEIKNPLAVIKGYLDMFDINNKNHSKDYIPIIKEEVNRTLLLINDFLSMNKISINKDIIDINMLIEQLFNNYKLIFKEKNIQANLNISEDEIFINGDYNRLTQVFVNILKNSIEAIENKGIINIDVINDEDDVLIKFIDNGSGIEDISKVKEMFYTTKQGGTGLGVPLSYEIIKGHDGVINYDSKLGEGTTVTIKLPLYKI